MNTDSSQLAYQPDLLTLLQESYQNRLPYLKKNKIELYRLYNFESSELPVAIDIYKENAVIHLFSDEALVLLPLLEEVLGDLLKIKNFFYKNRTKQEIPLPVAPKMELDVEEYGHIFHLNLSDYLDIGLFLDHRETRKWVAAQSENKVVANLFAYTGSFSVYAAKAGATKTHSVDLSKTYCEWIKTNLALNDLPLEKNWVYKMDALEFLNYAKRKELLFDIIIIDPPTFSKNKGKSFSVQQDHPALINAALKVLSPNGFIVFSNNNLNFTLKTFKIDECVIEEKKDSIPPDFSGSDIHKCFIIRHAPSKKI